MRYEHTQDIPSSSWVVTHNLYTRTPIVETFIEVGGELQKILPKRVRATSLTECVIEWTTPRTGKAGII